MKEKQAYSIKETANILGVHYTTIYGWLRRGLIKSMKMPTGHHRIHKDEIARVIK